MSRRRAPDVDRPRRSHLGRARGVAPWSLLAALLTLPACAPEVIDHSPASNLLDADSASLEAGLGEWTAWFSTRISRDPSAAKVGGFGLEVQVTDPYGWGVQVDNYPGFTAAAGIHQASFWAKAPGGGQTAALELSWRNENGDELQHDALTSAPLGAEWVKTAGELTAPEGTSRVGVMVTGEDGAPGETILLDAFVVQAAPGSD